MSFTFGIYFSKLTVKSKRKTNSLWFSIIIKIACNFALHEIPKSAPHQEFCCSSPLIILRDVWPSVRLNCVLGGKWEMILPTPWLPAACEDNRESILHPSSNWYWHFLTVSCLENVTYMILANVFILVFPQPKNKYQGVYTAYVSPNSRRQT